MILDALIDSLIDSAKLIPFLLLTYVLLEYLEHKATKKTEEFIGKSGRFGPLFGSLLGVIPQCGFSAAASGLYAGRVITMGTLISIYLSTSDEMLPILISEQVGVSEIFKILGLKVLIGIIGGFAVDLIFRQKDKETAPHTQIEHMCDHEHCHCKEGKIFKSAIIHTLQVIAFIFIVSLVLNILIAFVGEDAITAFVSDRKILSVFLAALIGLVPNCAASVVITQLYLDGILGFGAMMAGLLVGAGVGLLVLFKANDALKDNLKIVGILYVIGVISGFSLLKF